MPDVDLRFPPLVGGGLIVTYRCTSRCRHCLYRASPRRDPAYMDPETAGQLAHRVAALGAHAVHIGGGEPFLEPDGLLSVLRAVQRTDLEVEYVETNASWFTDLPTAREMLEALRAAGLTTLLVSVSPFHNEFIPFAKTLGVLRACREVGINPLPWEMAFFADLEILDPVRPHRLEEHERTHGAGYLRHVAARGWIHPGGRALDTFRGIIRKLPAEALLATERGGCRDLRRTDHFHVDLHGRYVPGLCAGIAVPLACLESPPLEEARYPVLTLLLRHGIRGLLQWAQQEHAFEPRASGYLSKCDLCDHIRSYLVRTAGFETPELAPAEFYAEPRR